MNGIKVETFGFTLISYFDSNVYIYCIYFSNKFVIPSSSHRYASSFNLDSCLTCRFTAELSDQHRWPAPVGLRSNPRTLLITPCQNTYLYTHIHSHSLVEGVINARADKQDISAGALAALFNRKGVNYCRTVTFDVNKANNVRNINNNSNNLSL